ncbi:hypothetical protein ACFYU8_17915 [Brevibacillus sp. NPDC003359]|uniref:hypothetical protein n=1 Tax=unclassified Brevibacillus TaxID=2684853 RepID=UPI0036C7DC72
MVDILFFLVISLVGVMWWRARKGESLIPFIGKKRNSEPTITKSTTKNLSKSASPKQTKKLIKEMLNIKDLKMNMIVLPKHEYVMALRCDPVNYHLRNPIEQEGIDVRFEQWLVSMDYPVVWHLQSRYVDLRQQAEDYVKGIENDHLLSSQAKEYCYMIVDYMNNWLAQQPRFETVRYVLFPYQLKDPGMKKTSNEERAFLELERRITSAQSYLEGCGVHSEICTTEGLAEMLYYSLNRKRAAKARFKDIKLREMLALFCTSQQDSVRIQKVRQRTVVEQKGA